MLDTFTPMDALKNKDYGKPRIRYEILCLLRSCIDRYCEIPSSVRASDLHAEEIQHTFIQSPIQGNLYVIHVRDMH